ncbi:MAG TPA: HYR domain-containing protein, partial [Saprospiraceae bacterium]|nr:HYR domain-containing protein [Saprospiraceae bacterium]
ACDTLATYILQLLPQVSFTDTIAFCPGESVVIDGETYTQPGTVKDTLPGMNGACDTLATYVLVSLLPAPSVVTLTCPNDLTINADPPVVIYNLPVAATDCPCPGISLQLTAGLPSGSVFPLGVTTVCYVAKDSCGNTASCCFKVTVTDDGPCDEATIGCVKFELMGISEDSAGNNTYRIQVTNNCLNKLMYVAFSLPPGVTALAPPNNSIYTAPSGREYSVRNPNFSPFYSIRFKSDMAGIANGESDLFEYKLPAVANPADINVIVRVEPKVFYQTYLHTSGCIVEDEPKPVQAGTDSTTYKKSSKMSLNHLTVFPNPTTGLLFVNISDWRGEQVNVQVLDSRGQRVQQLVLTAGAVPQEIQLPENLPGGLYFLEI